MAVEYKIGDCLKLFKEVKDGSVDLVLTDPPFGVGYDYETDQFEDFRDGEEYFPWVEEWFWEVKRVLKDGGVFLCFSSPKFIREFLNLGATCKFQYQETIIWDKVCAHSHNGPKRPLPNYEPCFFWTKGDKWTYNPPCQNVLRYVRQTSDSGIKHRASRPIGLYVELVKVFSNPDELVLDPFVGSGTTLLACRMTGRNGLGFEINSEYEEVIKSRMLAKIPDIESFDDQEVETILAKGATEWKSA